MQPSLPQEAQEIPPVAAPFEASPLTRGLFFLVLLPLFAFICISGVSRYYYSPDELTHTEIAHGKNTAEVLSFSLYETHPPLGHLLRHYWMGLADEQGFVRGLSLLFGLGFLCCLYAIGTQLGGPWAGICTALLGAFSPGVIIQSYIAKNYSILLFFVAAASLSHLHWRLHWRRNHDWPALVAYTFFGCCAVASHFSGIFALVCIGSAESIALLRIRAPRRILLGWMAAQLIPACAALALYHYWQPVLALTSAQYQLRIAHVANSIHSYAPLYPFMALSYFFTYLGNAYVQLSVFAVIFFLWLLAWRGKDARLYIIIGLMALALGTFLLATGRYPASGNRYSLWIFPLIAPPLGCGMARICAIVQRRLIAMAHADMLILCILLFIGWLSYQPAARFGGYGEYLITHERREEVIAYLKTLDAHSLIIANRNDAFLYAPPGLNLYSLYHPPSVKGNQAFAGAADMQIVPYYHTRIMFKPYYTAYNQDYLKQFVRDLQAAGELDQVDSLVFLSTLWDRQASFNLILCPALTKRVIAFPRLAPDERLTAADLRKLDGIALIVPKTAFFSEFISPEDAANHCPDATH